MVMIIINDNNPYDTYDNDNAYRLYKLLKMYWPRGGGEYTCNHYSFITNSFILFNQKIIAMQYLGIKIGEWTSGLKLTP